MNKKHVVPRASGRFSPKALREFIAICKEDFGEQFSEDEAQELASDLVDFYLVLFPRKR